MYVCVIQHLKSWQDFMISLKLLITKRAERIGCKNLADRFDLKTIRAIGMSYALV